jgi:DNA-binding MarR family transcriptional regulator
MLTLEAIEAMCGPGDNPSLREVARVRELTLAGLQHHIRLLERAGLLQKRVKGNARAFKVLDTARANEDWIAVTKVTLNRGQTRTADAIREALSVAIEDAFDKVDLQGSQIELTLRHRV